MRILHVVTLVDDRNSYGGPLTVALNHCQELLRRGHDASIAAGWAGTARPPAELEGVPAHLFPVTTVIPGMRFSGLWSPGLARWLRVERRAVDVAHVHLARDLIPLGAAMSLRRAGVPYVTQTHGMVVPDGRLAARVMDRLATLPVLRSAATRFILTAAEQRAVTELCGPQSPTELLPNGVRPARAPRDRPSSGVLDILFMARLHPRKRVLEFANAAEQICSERSDVTFSVVGSDDGDLADLQRFISERPTLANRLRYEGGLPHAQAIQRLADADVYVLPSVDEPFPMSVLEALGAGTPTVCTTSCGIAEALAARDAIAVASPAPGALATTLSSLIDDPRRRDSLRSAGMAAIRSEYSIQVVVDRLDEQYQRCVSGA